MRQPPSPSFRQGKPPRLQIPHLVFMISQGEKLVNFCNRFELDKSAETVIIKTDGEPENGCSPCRLEKRNSRPVGVGRLFLFVIAENHDDESCETDHHLHKLKQIIPVYDVFHLYPSLPGADCTPGMEGDTQT